MKRLVPLWLFLFALSIRLAVLAWWQFDGLYGQDAFAYFQQAAAIRENLPQGRPPPTDFFWPNGFPLLAALFMGLLGPTAVAAQTAVLLCGAALSPLVYGLSRELFPEAHPGGGIVAGLIVATAGQPVLSSITIMADIPALFWAALAGWLLVRGWRRSGRPWYLAAAGAALALAVVSRWLYASLVPAFVAYSLLARRRYQTPWLQLGLPLGSGVAILLPQIWLSRYKPEGLWHSFLLGWHPANAFLRQFEINEGYFLYKLPVALFYAQPAGHPAYLFPLLGVMGLWGIWRLWQQRAWRPLTFLLGWSGAVYLVLAGIAYQNFRYGLALYLPPVLLAGFGFSNLWPRDRPLVRPALLLLVVLSLAGSWLWSYRMLDAFLTTQNQSKRVARQVEDHLPPNAILVTFGLTLVAQHYTELDARELFSHDESSLAHLVESEAPIFLLLDLGNVESQWAGRAPEVNYRWLRRHAALLEMGVYPPYTLFQVARWQEPD